MFRKFLAMGAAALALAGVVTGVSLASDETFATASLRSGTVDRATSGQPGVLEGEAKSLTEVNAMASEPPSCWTQFAPTWPAGLPMTQYYRNCNGHGVWAFGGYTQNGTTYNSTGCYYFADGDWALWDYSWTPVGGAQFGTFAC